MHLKIQKSVEPKRKKYLFSTRLIIFQLFIFMKFNNLNINGEKYMNMNMFFIKKTFFIEALNLALYKF